MALFNYEIQMAGEYGSSDNTEAWDLFAKIDKLLAKSPMQLNYSILKKDGTQIPTSKEGWDKQEQYQKTQARRQAEEEVIKAERLLAEARRRFESLK